MSSFTDYFENKLVDQIFRGQAYTFPASLARPPVSAVACQSVPPLRPI